MLCRLTYMGYDFLAIKALVARGHISGVGRQIGVGKESDIFEVRLAKCPTVAVCLCLRLVHRWEGWGAKTAKRVTFLRCGNLDA
jgi:RIO-like serine/threonine protein kinase